MAPLPLLDHDCAWKVTAYSQKKLKLPFGLHSAILRNPLAQGPLRKEIRKPWGKFHGTRFPVAAILLKPQPQAASVRRLPVSVDKGEPCVVSTLDEAPDQLIGQVDGMP